jgi:hypothetical protein
MIGRGGIATQQERPCDIPVVADVGATSNEEVSLGVPPQTTWQPRGGKVQFTFESSSIKLRDIRVAVCFGWKTTSDTVEASVRSPQVDLVSSTDTKATLTAVVPDLPSVPDRWPNRLWTNNPFHFFSSGLVPIAVMRVYASGGALTLPLDERREVGVTSTSIP